MMYIEDNILVIMMDAVINQTIQLEFSFQERVYFYKTVVKDLKANHNNFLNPRVKM